MSESENGQAGTAVETAAPARPVPHPHHDMECGWTGPCRNAHCVEPEMTWCKRSWCRGPGGVRRWGSQVMLPLPWWLALIAPWVMKKLAQYAIVDEWRPPR